MKFLPPPVCPKADYSWKKKIRHDLIRSLEKTDEYISELVPQTSAVADDYVDGVHYTSNKAQQYWMKILQTLSLLS